MVKYFKGVFAFIFDYIEIQKSKQLAKKISKEDPFIYK